MLSKGGLISVRQLNLTNRCSGLFFFQSQRVAEISGIRESDIIANLFPLTQAPMGAFLRSATNAYAAGAAIFAALPGAPHGAFGVHRPLEHAVHLIEAHAATILWGVPSFVRRRSSGEAQTGPVVSSASSRIERNLIR